MCVCITGDNNENPNAEEEMEDDHDASVDACYGSDDGAVEHVDGIGERVNPNDGTLVNIYSPMK